MSDISSAVVRPLPRAPSLEYERKQAKALLKRIRIGDDEAIRRVRDTHPAALHDRRADELKLADAQHVIAREYGFTSWPRLVEYFAELERQRNVPRGYIAHDDVDRFEGQARSIVQRHQAGDVMLAVELAHFVPRFYARSTAEILTSPITIEEARLVVAREERRSSWSELLAVAGATRELKGQVEWAETPITRAGKAIRDEDVSTLAALLDEHQELLAPSLTQLEWRQTVGSMALSHERSARTPTARAICDLLAARGVDMQHELNEKLLGWPQEREQPQTLAWYLERGADPNWMPPNGISVLEHAIVRYWNGACVDLIAKRVAPREALWIAAGVGDVRGVRSYLAGKGKLTAKGRLNRPDLMAMSSLPWPPLRHDAEDIDIMWEAFLLAGWNARWDVMDVLLDAGLPVDHAPMGTPLLTLAVGNRLISLAEYLVRRGADVDRVWGSPAHGSARSMARSQVGSNPENREALRLLDICGGGDVVEIVAEFDAKRTAPVPLPSTLRAMQLAADDAARQGQGAVTTENLFVGLLRAGGLWLFKDEGTNRTKLQALLGARLRPDTDPLIGQDLPSDAAAEAVVRAGHAEADRRRRDVITPMNLAAALLVESDGPVAHLLNQIGTRREALLERLKGLL